eukprot:2483478-Rhodomonas_salina.3
MRCHCCQRALPLLSACPPLLAAAPAPAQHVIASHGRQRQDQRQKRRLLGVFVPAFGTLVCYLPQYHAELLVQNRTRTSAPDMA